MLVPKPDKTVRIAVDYRQSNKWKSASLPYQRTLFRKLSGNAFFAKMDNLKGYHQLRLTDRASEYSTIVTPWGLYRFTRCPFGISTAPGAYQEAMHSLLGDLILNGVLVYIDDTVVYAKSVDSFLDLLDQTLSRMAQFNVRLRPSKCYFGFSSIEYLGHIFDRGGSRLTDARKQGILDLKVPIT